MEKAYQIMTKSEINSMNDVLSRYFGDSNSICINQEIANQFEEIVLKSFITDNLRASSVPIYEKENLTIEEASLLFNIGQNKLREMTNERDCDFVLYKQSQKLIKRRKLQQYLENSYSI